MSIAAGSAHELLMAGAETLLLFTVWFQFQECAIFLANVFLIE